MRHLLRLPPMGPLALTLICVLWLISLGNWPLWSQLARLPEVSGLRGVLFGAAFAVIIGAGLMLLLALLTWRWTLKPALTVCLLAAASGAYFMHAYGVVIDRTMMVNVLQTDSREARELMNGRMLLTVLLLGVLPAVWLWRQPVVWPRAKRLVWHNLAQMVGAVVVAVATLLLVFQDFSSVMRNHTQMRYLINPLNGFYALALVAVRPADRGAGPVLPLAEDARLTPPRAGDKPPLALFVVGETARADHIGLNGYARPTTPQLAGEDVASLRNAWSCGTNTATSVPCMFSALGREAFDQRKSNSEGLVDALQRAGLAVLWIDNQAGGCKGVCTRVPTVDAKTLHDSAWCDASGECLDEVMLQGLDARIAALPAERRARGVVVFMHQMGSHGPAYYKRSPPALKAFTPECTTSALQQCAREQIVNAYDNTLRYTDHFLAASINWLKRQGGHAPLLVYLSDHGESLGENNVYLHGLPYRFAPDAQKHVPWITWLSPQFQQQSGITTACLRAKADEPVSHDNYFHSVLGLLGVQTSVYQPALDIHASCRAS